MERFLENAMYASRWLLAPIYFGLSLGLLALMVLPGRLSSSVPARGAVLAVALGVFLAIVMVVTYHKINEYAEMLKAAGIDPAELVNTVVPENTKVSKRAPRPAKYRYLDNGVEMLISSLQIVKMQIKMVQNGNLTKTLSLNTQKKELLLLTS